MTSPPECRVTTEVMTRWRDLWRQRLRWHRGALENIGAYGLDPGDRDVLDPAARAGLRGGGAVVLPALMVITLLAADSIRWSPFWVTIGLVFFVERLVTVWAVGWRGRWLAAPILVELAYAAVPPGLLRHLDRARWRPVAKPVGTTSPVPWSKRRPAAGPRHVRHPAAGFGPATAGTRRCACGWLQHPCVVVLSLLQLLPPLRRDARRGWTRSRAARRGGRRAALE